jgi:TRAP-type C4-dicarboxylate transport system permease small subunit
MHSGNGSVRRSVALAALDACERWFVAVNRGVLIVLLGSMAVIVFANVLMRYLTNASIPWSEEVARHMMIWLTFLGAGPVLRAGAHIAVENLQDAAPLATARAIRLLVVLLLMAFFVLLVWVGGAYVLRSVGQRTAATQISFAWVYAAIPVGGVLLIVHLLLVVKGYVLHRRFKADERFDATSSASL